MMLLFITYQIGKVQKFWLHCIQENKDILIMLAGKDINWQDLYKGNLVLPMKIINAQLLIEFYFWVHTTNIHNTWQDLSTWSFNAESLVIAKDKSFGKINVYQQGND